MLGIHNSTAQWDQLEDQNFQLQHYGTLKYYKDGKTSWVSLSISKVIFTLQRKLRTSIDYEIHLCPSIKVL
jgi:hypothetical protein